MKEKLEKKIEEILEYIMAKDVEKITPCDYGILESALKEIRMNEEIEERSKAFNNALNGVLCKTYRTSDMYPLA